MALAAAGACARPPLASFAPGVDASRPARGDAGTPGAGVDAARGDDATRAAAAPDAMPLVARRWRDPVEISRPGWVAGPDMQVAVSARGDAVVLFHDGDGIWAQRYEYAAGAFTPPLLLSDGGSTVASQGLLAMDDAGDAIAAWPASDVAGPILVARRFDVTAGWPGGWAPAEIVARGWNGLGSLAMTPSGAAVAAWTNSATTASIAVYEVGRGWAAPAQFSPGGTDVMSVQAAIADLGGALTVIVAADVYVATGHSYVAGAVFRYDLATHAGALDAPHVLVARDDVDKQQVGVGIDAAGNGAVGLFDFVGGDERHFDPYAGKVYVVRHTSEWQPPEVAFEGPGRYPKFVMSRNGDVFVTFLDCTPPGCTYAYETRRTSGTVWRPAAPLQAPGAGFVYPPPIVACDGSGDGFLLTNFSNAAAQGAGLAASHLDPSGTWSPPDVVATAPPNAAFEWYALGVGPDGTAVAVWSRLVSDPALTPAESIRSITAAVYRAD